MLTGVTQRFHLELGDVPAMQSWLRSRGATVLNTQRVTLYAPLDPAWDASQLQHTTHVLWREDAPDGTTRRIFAEDTAHRHCDTFEQHRVMEARLATDAAAERFLSQYRPIREWSINAESVDDRSGALCLELAGSGETPVAATLVCRADPAPLLEELAAAGLRLTPLRELEATRLERLTSRIAEQAG